RTVYFPGNPTHTYPEGFSFRVPGLRKRIASVRFLYERTNERIPRIAFYNGTHNELVSLILSALSIYVSVFFLHLLMAEVTVYYILSFGDQTIQISSIRQKLLRQMPNSHHSGIPSMMKLLVPVILPSTVEKVIVMDSDMLFNHNVLELWELFYRFNSTQVSVECQVTVTARHFDWCTNLIKYNNTDFHEVPDTELWVTCKLEDLEYQKGELGSKVYGTVYTKKLTTVPPKPQQDRGLNGGLSIMHLTRLRENGWHDKWQEASKKFFERNTMLKQADQDIFNTVIEMNPTMYFRIPCEWNIQLCSKTTADCCPVVWPMKTPTETDCKRGGRKKTEEFSPNMARLVHFTGQDKDQYVKMENTEQTILDGTKERLTHICTGVRTRNNKDEVSKDVIFLLRHRFHKLEARDDHYCGKLKVYDELYKSLITVGGVLCAGFIVHITFNERSGGSRNQANDLNLERGTGRYFDNLDTALTLTTLSVFLQYYVVKIDQTSYSRSLQMLLIGRASVTGCTGIVKDSVLFQKYSMESKNNKYMINTFCNETHGSYTSKDLYGSRLVHNFQLCHMGHPRLTWSFNFGVRMTFETTTFILDILEMEGRSGHSFTPIECYLCSVSVQVLLSVILHSNELFPATYNQQQYVKNINIPREDFSPYTTVKHMIALITTTDVEDSVMVFSKIVELMDRDSRQYEVFFKLQMN
ncbi:glycosyltransferase-like protein LARGE, partial [Clonorchis sinensis]